MRVPSRRRILAAFVPLLASLSTVAKAINFQRYDLQIIVGDRSPATLLILEEMRRKFPGASIGNQVNKKRSSGKLPIYLAVGPDALRYLTGSGLPGPVISTFTSQKAYHAIVSKAPVRPGSTTAIFADPSPIQQFQLIGLIYGKPIKVGVILSSDNEQIESILRRSVTPRQAEVTYERLAPGEDITRVLTRLADVQAILAMPDSAVYNAETIRTVLVSTYRRDQTLIGFSAAVVKVGALATTYTTIPDSIAQIDEMLSSYEASGHLPELQFPKYFDVAINVDVARSLNIVLSNQVSHFSRKPGGKAL
jgi:hypothetical protein